MEQNSKSKLWATYARRGTGLILAQLFSGGARIAPESGDLKKGFSIIIFKNGQCQAQRSQDEGSYHVPRHGSVFTLLQKVVQLCVWLCLCLSIEERRQEHILGM